MAAGQNKNESWPGALDALAAAPQQYILLLENEKMRVLETRIAAGESVPAHTHRWPGVLFIESWSELIRRDQNGRTLLDTRLIKDKPGLNVPLWQEALTLHSVENVGGQEFRAIQVEIKDGSNRHALTFRELAVKYAVVKLGAGEAVPDWANEGEFTSITRTREELSIVCAADSVPSGVHSPHRWICLQLEGPFPFSQTGVLLSFIEPLSRSGIPIFAISTYDTDYVMIQEDFASAFGALREAGHQQAPSTS